MPCGVTEMAAAGGGALTTTQVTRTAKNDAVRAADILPLHDRSVQVARLASYRLPTRRPGYSGNLSETNSAGAELLLTGIPGAVPEIAIREQTSRSANS
jgi:hypothetical protein